MLVIIIFIDFIHITFFCLNSYLHDINVNFRVGAFDLVKRVNHLNIIISLNFNEFRL